MPSSFFCIGIDWMTNQRWLSKKETPKWKSGRETSDLGLWQLPFAAVYQGSQSESESVMGQVLKLSRCTTSATKIPQQCIAGKIKEKRKKEKKKKRRTRRKRKKRRKKREHSANKVGNAWGEIPKENSWGLFIISIIFNVLACFMPVRWLPW